MTYQSVWWRPNYLDFGHGLNCTKTWLEVKEQYRRPDMLHDNRYHEIPRESGDKLYYRYPRMCLPTYRGRFRDAPATVPSHYPGICPLPSKPDGFHGRVYYETGPPQFKYDGPRKDELYWLERNPYLPKPIDHRLLGPPTTCQPATHLSCLLCADNDTKVSGCVKGMPHITKFGFGRTSNLSSADKNSQPRKMTQDNVGFL